MGFNNLKIRIFTLTIFNITSILVKGFIIPKIIFLQTYLYLALCGRTCIGSLRTSDGSHLCRVLYT